MYKPAGARSITDNRQPAHFAMFPALPAGDLNSPRFSRISLFPALFAERIKPISSALLDNPTGFNLITGMD